MDCQSSDEDCAHENESRLLDYLFALDRWRDLVDDLCFGTNKNPPHPPPMHQPPTVDASP